MSEIIEIVGEENLNELIAGHVPVLIDFWAPWCGPCKTMLPIVLEVAKQFYGKLIVAKVNIDQLPEVASKYRVSSIPYLSLFKEGRCIADLIGLQSPTVLQDFLLQNLNN